MPSSPEKSDNYKKGHKFEKLAAHYFVENGYQLLETNWRAGRNEIDLIVQKDSLLIFVEVKSASSTKYGHPSERVDQNKIKAITKVARQYLIDKKIENVDLRFDVVTFLDGQLEHYSNAFEAAE